jgi:hypothetical protein
VHANPHIDPPSADEEEHSDRKSPKADPQSIGKVTVMKSASKLVSPV